MQKTIYPFTELQTILKKTLYLQSFYRHLISIKKAVVSDFKKLYIQFHDTLVILYFEGLLSVCQ